MSVSDEESSDPPAPAFSLMSSQAQIASATTADVQNHKNAFIHVISTHLLVIGSTTGTRPQLGRVRP
jgi:hypothetical protein